MVKTNSNSKNDKAPAKRRRNAAPVLGVEAFAHRKGVTKALQGFRERKEKKRVQTATALRQYKKVMKKEGYQPGQGASRKRFDGGENDDGDGDADEDKPRQHQQQQQRRRPEERKQRTHLFQKAVQKAEDKKEKVQQTQQDRDSNDKERVKKLKQRSYRTKLHCQRTKKGQPVMKNLVEDILIKLEKEKQHGNK